jgi:hypothetical protein
MEFVQLLYYCSLLLIVAPLRRYATRCKVTGSTPDKDNDFIFSVPNLSGRTVASEITQPLTEKSTTRFLGVKRVRLTNLSRSVSRLSRQCGILNISQLYKPPRFVTVIALFYGGGMCFL